MLFYMSMTAITNELGKSGFCVCPGFLAPEFVTDARADLEQLFLLGNFHQAGVGRTADFQKI